MREIPQHLIDECEKLAEENKTTYFIFDKNESNSINLKLRPNKENERESKIEQIIEETFHIGTIDEFSELPSRFAHYDTETKLVGRYEKYNFVTKLLLKIGFEPSVHNFGPEFEQTFCIVNSDSNEMWFVRLKPNLFLSIRYSNYSDTQVSDFEIFNGFFNKNHIITALNQASGSLRETIRDLKLEQIIQH